MNPELVNRWLLDNDEAHKFCVLIWDMSHIWDDLIDKDVPVTDSQINEAFITALIHIPRNSFYQQHIQELLPIMQNSIYEWLDANAIEAKGKSEIAYVIRSSIGMIVLTCARLIGGDTWARSISLEIRNELYGNEDYQQYLGEK